MLIEQWVPDRSEVCCVVGAGFLLCVFRPSWPTAHPVSAEERCWSWAFMCEAFLSKSAAAFPTQWNRRKAVMLSRLWGASPCKDSASDDKYFIGHSCLIKVSSNTLDFSYSFTSLLFSITCLLECLTLLIHPGKEGNCWFWHFLNRKSKTEKMSSVETN